MKQGALPSWEHFHHVADIGVRGNGNTLAEAFEQAALAMTAVITSPDRIADTTLVEISVSGADRELLLTEWLDALIYEMATRKMLFRRFEVQIHNLVLRAKAWGESIDVPRHQPCVEVKGATLTELAIWHDADGTWHAQCVLDV